jgi:hypothetical protein
MIRALVRAHAPPWVFPFWFSASRWQVQAEWLASFAANVLQLAFSCRRSAVIVTKGIPEWPPVNRRPFLPGRHHTLKRKPRLTTIPRQTPRKGLDRATDAIAIYLGGTAGRAG